MDLQFEYTLPNQLLLSTSFSRVATILLLLSERVPIVLQGCQPERGPLEQLLDVLQAGQVLPVALPDVLDVGRGQEVDERVGATGQEGRAHGIEAKAGEFWKEF